MGGRPPIPYALMHELTVLICLVLIAIFTALAVVGMYKLYFVFVPKMSNYLIEKLNKFILWISGNSANDNENSKE